MVLGLLLAWHSVAATCIDHKAATAPDGRCLDNAAGTITDILHGLDWKRCNERQDGADCSTGTASMLNWQQALQLVDTLNVFGGYAGHSNRRLPNIAN